MEVSQHESMIAMLGEFFSGDELAGLGRMGNRDLRLVPNGIYPCAGDDEWVAISVRDEGDWTRLCEVLDADVLRDAALCSVESRRASEDEIDEAIRSWTSGLPAPVAEQRLRAAGLPAARVRSIADVLTCPQLNAEGYLQTVVQPEGIAPAPMPGIIAHLSSTPGRIRMPAPGHGEHSYEVLQRILGCSETELDELEAKGIIGAGPPPA